MIVTILAFMGMPSSTAAEYKYAQVISNDMRQCSPDKGPSVRLRITGLRSSAGNLFVRTYRARGRDWLKSKGYLSRLDATPRVGSMTVCVPLPAQGNYAIAVQHDANGNREVDFSTDGVAMSNNPKVGSFLFIPIPPSVKKAAFTAGPRITDMTVKVRYRN